MSKEVETSKNHEARITPQEESPARPEFAEVFEPPGQPKADQSVEQNSKKLDTVDSAVVKQHDSIEYQVKQANENHDQINKSAELANLVHEKINEEADEADSNAILTNQTSEQTARSAKETDEQADQTKQRAEVTELLSQKTELKAIANLELARQATAHPDNTNRSKVLRRPDACEVINNNGSRVSIFNNGRVIVENEDRTRFEDNGSGETTTANADGSFSIINGSADLHVNADGSMQSNNADGSENTLNENGSSRLIETNGNTELKNTDGSAQVRKVKGEVIETNTDGSSRSRKNDGTVRLENGDGSSQTKLPDGNILTQLANGSERKHVSDGTIQTTAPDGTSKTNTPDGTSTIKLADGSSWSKKLDGTVSSTTCNGSVRTSELNGCIKTILADGSSRTKSAEGTITTDTIDGSSRGTTANKTRTCTTAQGRSELADPSMEYPVFFPAGGRFRSSTDSSYRGPTNNQNRQLNELRVDATQSLTGVPDTLPALDLHRPFTVGSDNFKENLRGFLNLIPPSLYLPCENKPARQGSSAPVAGPLDHGYNNTNGRSNNDRIGYNDEPNYTNNEVPASAGKTGDTATHNFPADCDNVRRDNNLRIYDNQQNSTQNLRLPFEGQEYQVDPNNSKIILSSPLQSINWSDRKLPLWLNERQAHVSNNNSSNNLLNNALRFIADYHNSNSELQFTRKDKQGTTEFEKIPGNLPGITRENIDLRSMLVAPYNASLATTNSSISEKVTQVEKQAFEKIEQKTSNKEFSATYAYSNCNSKEFEPRLKDIQNPSVPGISCALSPTPQQQGSGSLEGARRSEFAYENDQSVQSSKLSRTVVSASFEPKEILTCVVRNVDGQNHYVPISQAQNLSAGETAFSGPFKSSFDAAGKETATPSGILKVKTLSQEEIDAASAKADERKHKPGKSTDGAERVDIIEKVDDKKVSLSSILLELANDSKNYSPNSHQRSHQIAASETDTKAQLRLSQIEDEFDSADGLRKLGKELVRDLKGSSDEELEPSESFSSLLKYQDALRKRYFSELEEKQEDEKERCLEQARKYTCTMLDSLETRQIQEEAERSKQKTLKGEQRIAYVVKAGDTLEFIAARRLYSKNLAILIYEINKNRIPTSVKGGRQRLQLKPGFVLFLPTLLDIRKHQTKHFRKTPAVVFEYDYDFEYRSHYSGPIAKFFASESPNFRTAS